MKVFRPQLMWMIVAAIMAASLWVYGGPLLPTNKGVMPEEVQSLAGLRKFHLEVASVPRLLIKRGVTEEQLIEIARSRFEVAGFQILDDPGLPTLMIQMSTKTQREQPKAVSLGVVTSLRQNVTVTRLGRDIMVPTTTIWSTHLTTRDKVVPDAETALIKNMNMLTSLIHHATEEIENATQ